MREKLHYKYTNNIDRIVLISRPLDDMDKTMELGKKARIE